MAKDADLLTLAEASRFASKLLGRQVTQSNISYLVQYGRVRKSDVDGGPAVRAGDLEDYYRNQIRPQEKRWKEKLGDDLNWRLSFTEYREAERTKHVHRLHPYKGKFIPQLAEYFLDGHTDAFKKEACFGEEDVVLDPFCGSGTTLVQANELGMHAVGVDVSAFNALVGNVKIGICDVDRVESVFSRLTESLREFRKGGAHLLFDAELTDRLKAFNQKYFPSPDYRRAVNQGKIPERRYAAEKLKEFLPVFDGLVRQYGVEVAPSGGRDFLDEWYAPPVRREMDFLLARLKGIRRTDVKDVARVVLSRTIRSCRATTHADLGTLKEPVARPYYCKKHGKVCKPILSLFGWWRRYCEDTCRRLRDFGALRTETHQHCLVGDSRTIDVRAALAGKNKALADLVASQKIKGIFSSPPYVGLIDYHEQHAYSYDLFGFSRRDAWEIGPLSKGQGRQARASYATEIAKVLVNCRRFLCDDFDVFLVANDKYDLYPQIAEASDLRIVHQYRRPVLNRVEKDRTTAYSETIFHLKAKRLWH